MKNIKSFFAVTLFLLPLFSFTVDAQTDENALDMPVFGIGLHAEQFRGIDAVGVDNIAGYYSAYTTTVLLPINITQHFRFEPEIGLIWIKDINENANLGLSNGLGIFGMFQKGKANFYAGGRIGLDFIRLEGYYSINDEKSVEKYTAFSIGPTFGFEYFLSNNFSLGGEIGVRYISSKGILDYPDETPNEETKSSIIGLDGGLFLRAYF